MDYGVVTTYGSAPAIGSATGDGAVATEGVNGARVVRPLDPMLQQAVDADCGGTAAAG